MFSKLMDSMERYAFLKKEIQNRWEGNDYPSQIDGTYLHQNSPSKQIYYHILSKLFYPLLHNPRHVSN